MESSDEGRSYTTLEVWNKSRALVKHVYMLTKAFPKEEIFGLTSQVRSAVVSVPSNIAEGCGRQYAKEAVHFFHISRGSLYETETQLYVAADLEYITMEQLRNVLSEITSCKKLLNGFIKYYKGL
ncbi:four helix bundle protein [Pontibacter diazotrophicus]|uniref:Four helix bundle protein n=1 Tax=Pontibacter diazotrophicus TaxID=1400979 RepID=A0A3D8LEW9_9BACT|nr:four helix bundle protein [Pontibacter diazotrophicus]RDV15955.1 four helix bundle protein [Pontibacter diazotrophicus]